MRTYKVTFTVRDKNNSPIEVGVDEVEASIQTEAHRILENRYRLKYTNYGSLLVHSTYEDILGFCKKSKK